MSRFILATLIVAFAMSNPAQASVQHKGDPALMPDCPHVLLKTYGEQWRKVNYRSVKHVFRKDAAGRNIKRWGKVRASKKLRKTLGRVRKATCGELRKSRAQLKVLLTPPRYSTLNRTSSLPAQPPAGVHSSSVSAGYPLSAIAQCESGGNPSTNTGNGFYGKYQFTMSTWASVGGSGNPAYASEEEQDRRAAALYAREGSSPWPVCGR